MGVREETLDMLRNGLSPKDITRARGVSIDTTLGYLDQLVGRGDLRRSDIFFTLPKDIREAVGVVANPIRWGLTTIETARKFLKHVGSNADEEDIIVAIKYGDARHALGDMYEDIRTIETFLHNLIHEKLMEIYGEGEFEWWRKGIPISVRQNCQSRREQDEDPVEDPYCYTDLLDLWHILDKQWNVLREALPDKLKADKHILRKRLIRLNLIRNNVMHPVRGVTPCEDDFEFVRDLKEQLLLS